MEQYGLRAQIMFWEEAVTFLRVFRSEFPAATITDAINACALGWDHAKKRLEESTEAADAAGYAKLAESKE